MSGPSMHAPAPEPRLLLAVEARPDLLLPHLRRAWAGGPAILPLDPRLPSRARGALVAALSPGAIVKPGGIVSLPGGQPVPADVVAVVPTSGSTGPPKGVQLSGSALAAGVTAGLARTGLDPQIPWLCCLPVSHVAGLLVLLRGVVTGTEPILHDGFEPERIATMSERVHLAAVPTMLRRLFDAGADPDRWASVLIGGARMPDDLAERLPRAVTTYGMTESAGGCVYDGVPLDGVSVTESPDGRLRIGGPTLMSGYRAAQGTPGRGLDPDGRFTTNDVGRIAQDGTVTVLGRIDDVIVTGGEKVVAAEVAARIEQHPAVAEAEVVAVDDPEWGQRAVAVVVPAQVGAILSLNLLRSFVADAMPRYAAPQDLVVMNTLPRLGNGKVDRVTLRRSIVENS